MMQWHVQDVNITTNTKAKVDFTLRKFIAINVVTWKCHVDDSAKGRHYVTLGQDILT